MPIESVPFDDVRNLFDFYQDKAMNAPTAVQRNDFANVAMLPAAEPERLARLDHIVVTPDQ